MRAVFCRETQPFEHQPLFYIIHRNSVRTSRTTQIPSITKTSRWMYREIMLSVMRIKLNTHTHTHILNIFMRESTYCETGVQYFDKFSICNNICMFITVFTTTCHWPLYWNKKKSNIQPPPLIIWGFFLGAFVKLQKATISFVMSVCP